MKTMKRVLIVAAMAFMAVMLYQWGHVDGREGKSSGIISESIAAESPPKASPVKARARDFYAPNSEDLGPDEMRVIACGTGMPTTRASTGRCVFPRRTWQRRQVYLRHRHRIG